MSTTTNFKRIALVAVAALGLGVLSSVPSQATIFGDSLALSASTASQNTAETYTATSAVVTVRFSGATGDSVSVTAALADMPAGNGAQPYLRLVETSSATVDTTSGASRAIGYKFSANSAVKVQSLDGNNVTIAKFAVYLANSTVDTSVTGLKVGTYKVRLTPAAIGAGTLVYSTAQDLTITVSEAAILDTKASAATSTAYLVKAGAYTKAQALAQTADSTVAIASTAGSLAGVLAITQKNAAGSSTYASESITVTITGVGILGVGDTNTAATGRSLLLKKGDLVTIWSDGNAGVGTITATGSVSGAVLATKTVTFTGELASFTDATAAIAILGTTREAGNAVTFKAKDSALNTLSDGTYYAFSSDETIAIAGTVAYSNDSGTVSVTGVKAGTATITIGNASTLAASTIKSAPVTVRVGSTSITSVKVAFDKTTYAPGEKALITVTTLDSTNLPTVPNTALALFATGKGLKEDKLFSQGALSAADTVLAFAEATSATAGTVAGSKIYVVYMPLSGGAVKVSATLSDAATIATAIQGTEVSATATVLDSGSAALAAVTALATTVASLKTLIVTLTNLVLKIQKKVKA